MEFLPKRKEKKGGGEIVIFFMSKCIGYKIRIFPDTGFSLPMCARLIVFNKKGLREDE